MVYYQFTISKWPPFLKQREIPEESRLLSLPLPQGLTEVRGCLLVIGDLKINPPLETMVL